MIKIVSQVSKQAFTAYGVCELWKQELSTLIAIISRSASSGFSANYTIDQPGRFLFGKFQEEAPLACYWLRPCIIVCCRWIVCCCLFSWLWSASVSVSQWGNAILVSVAAWSPWNVIRLALSSREPWMVCIPTHYIDWLIFIKSI